MRTKSPFGYYGAKLKIARQIVQDLPPHNAWVEGFCGSAAVTLAKPPAAIEVINDADGEIVNFFPAIEAQLGSPMSRDRAHAVRARGVRTCSK